MYQIEGFLEIGIIVFLLIAIYIRIEISVFKVKVVKIAQNKVNLSRPIKIIQISDYHDNKLINKNRLIRRIKRVNPDIIALTGDIISANTTDFTKTIHFLKDILKISPNVYSVGGNHELRNIDGDEFKQQLKDIGIEDIEYSSRTVNIDGMDINLCGIPFNTNKYPKDEWQSKNSALFTVLLSHSPKTAIEYDGLLYDLALTGHMHGGQVRIPFVGAVVTPYGGLFPKYNKGLYELMDRWVYVDSGLGNSTYPLRTFNRVQISYIQIMNEK